MKGIGVCQRWKESFSAFWRDMGARPTPNHSIDRINGDLGYFKSNVRWATSETQSRNRACVRMISAFGETKTLKGWELDQRCSVSEATIRLRLKGGMGHQDAVALPVRPGEGIITAFGETKPLRHWLADRRCRAKRTTIIMRLHKYRWTPERAITERATR